MEELVEIKCLGCGRPRLVKPKTIYAYICGDCTKKLKQAFEEKNLQKFKNSYIINI